MVMHIELRDMIGRGESLFFSCGAFCKFLCEAPEKRHSSVQVWGYMLSGTRGKNTSNSRQLFTGNVWGVGVFVSCVCLHSAVLVCARSADDELAIGCLTVVVVVVQKWVLVWRCVSCA